MYLLNVIKKVYVLLVMCSMQSLLLHGMLDLNKDKETVCDIVVLNRLSHDDYHTYRTVAVLSKIHNEVIENRYRVKKQGIEKYIKDNKYTKMLSPVTGAKVWNKDFSQCSWVTYHTHIAGPKDLGLTLIGATNSEVISKYAEWGGFYVPIVENSCPFFDKEGRVCFYAYGLANAYDGTYANFIQYSINLMGDSKRDIYWFQYDTIVYDEKISSSQSLFMLLQYPVLMKAFLKSKLVVLDSYCKGFDQIIIFDIKGVTLPDDYKMFKKCIMLEQVENPRYINLYSSYTSYDSLDSEITKAIDDQYKNQQSEKSNGD